MSQSDEHSVRFGSRTIRFTLKQSSRKTLGISVNPDMTVTVTAPEGKDMEAIRKVVKKRAPWILRQQRFFEKARPVVTPRQYVSGETWRYLGRQYRLKILQGRPEGVKLKSGYLTVHVRDRDDVRRIKTLTEAWYREKALNYFTVKVDFCYEKLRKYEIRRPVFRIRKMKTRWGSCTKGGVVLLNPELIKVPSHCVEYVIMHEMCHLKHHDHGAGFYGLLSRVMPDWEGRKGRLDFVAFEVLALGG